MIRALYSAAAGMESQQLNLDVISNNLANVNTTGFKKSKIEFQDLLYENIRPPARSRATAPTAHRPADRPRLAAGRDLPDFHRRRTDPDRRAAGRRHPGRRIFPGADARRHAGLHARRRVEDRLPTAAITTSDGLLVQSGWQPIPDRHHFHHHFARTAR